MLYSYTKNPCAIDSLEVAIRVSAITIALDTITILGSSLSITFKNTLSAEEALLLNEIVIDHDGVALPQNFVQKVSTDSPKTSQGLSKMALYEPEGDSATIVTFNLADKCSWYIMSAQIVGETLTTSDSLTFSSSQSSWIDLTHGRCYDEDNIMMANANKWAVKVYVNDVLQTWDETVWSVDYPNGKVIFHSIQTGVVKANFSYATTSYYIVKPKAGKRLTIKQAEIQFSTNTQLPSPILFEPWFSGHPTYGTMAVPGAKIVYKNMKDFISACNGGQGLIPKLGELTYDVHVFPFDYARPKPIRYSDHIEIRVYIKNHQPVTGEYATGTFYVAIDAE